MLIGVAVLWGLSCSVANNLYVIFRSGPFNFLWGWGLGIFGLFFSCQKVIISSWLKNNYMEGPGSATIK